MVNNVQSESGANKVKVLYIAGCDRSGSTLLDCVLGEIDGVLAVGETKHLIYGAMTGEELCGCGVPLVNCELWGPVFDEFGKCALGRLRIRHMPFAMSPFRPKKLTETMDDLARQGAPIYKKLREITGARVLVDSSKGPSYALALAQSPEIDLHILHLVRDSRGVAYSFGKQKQKPEITWRSDYMDRCGPVQASVIWSGAQVGSEMLRLKGLPYMRLRYEDFIKGPLRSVERIMDFIGHDRSIDILDKEEIEIVPRRHHTLSGNPVRMQPGRLKLSADLAWHSHLPRFKKGVVSVLTWPLLLRYGYTVGERAGID